MGWSAGAGVRGATGSAAGRGACRGRTLSRAGLRLRRSEAGTTRAPHAGLPYAGRCALLARGGRRPCTPAGSGCACRARRELGSVVGGPATPRSRAGRGELRRPAPPTSPDRLRDDRVRPAALMEVQTFGGGRGCRGWAGRAGRTSDLHETGAREPIVGPRPAARPRGLIWPRAANGQRPPHFKGRAAQSAAPPSAAGAALFMEWGPIFFPQRPTLVAPYGSSSGITSPHPSPRPLLPGAPSSPSSRAAGTWARSRVLARAAADCGEGGFWVASRGLGGGGEGRAGG